MLTGWIRHVSGHHDHPEDSKGRRRRVGHSSAPAGLLQPFFRHLSSLLPDHYYGIEKKADKQLAFLLNTHLTGADKEELEALLKAFKPYQPEHILQL